MDRETTLAGSARALGPALSGSVDALRTTTIMKETGGMLEDQRGLAASFKVAVALRILSVLSQDPGRATMRVS